jgi:H3 lysine-79-specific histone-lysine N-methyltransferase
VCRLVSRIFLILKLFSDYLTPAQQSLFGSLPTDRPVETILSPLQQPSGAKSSPNSRNSNASSTSSLTSLSSSTSSLTSLSSSTSSLSSLSSAYSTSPSPRINYLRVVQRAINRHDGPLFQTTMITINTIFRTLKYPALPSDPFSPTPLNILKEAVRSWTTTGIPQKVVMRIIDETYQRSVGPHVESLKNYEAFSSSVYGELMPNFISDIITETCLNQNSLLIDLGSGVGNVVIQASLQCGCKSYGIELMPSPAKVARNQLEQVKIRCRMWGVSLGDVELEEGDMLNSQRLTELIPKADVILVNNKVFLQSRQSFLIPE